MGELRKYVHVKSPKLGVDILSKGKATFKKVTVKMRS